MRRSSMLAAGLAATLTLATTLAGCGPKGAGAPPPPPVSVANPLVQTVVDWDDFTGRFEAQQTVEVRARVGGYLQGVHFRDGQMVRKGQLLFTLDPRPAEALLASARAQLVQAQAQAAQTAGEVARAQSLLAATAISREEFEAKRAAAASGQAAVQLAQANVRARQLDLEFTRVVAPASGRVSNRRVDPGNLVSGGSSAADVLTTIVSSDPIYFVFDGSEALLLRYQREAIAGRAAPVKVRLQDETDYRWSGVLEFTDNAIDANSGAVRLRATIRNGAGFLRPGMFGHAQVVGSKPYQAMLIPDSAIVADGIRRIAIVVAPDGSTSPRPLVLGPLSGSLRVVRSGLTANDRVIVNGGQRVQMPGQKVTANLVKITQQAVAQPAGPTTTATPAATATAVN
jgi:RND family efflux transporter MFP subunit